MHTRDYSLSRNINIDGRNVGAFLFPRRNKFIRASLTRWGSLIPLREICERYDKVVSFRHPKREHALSPQQRGSHQRRVYATWVFIMQEFLFSGDVSLLVFFSARDAFIIILFFVFLNKNAARRNRRRTILRHRWRRNSSRFVSRYFALTGRYYEYPIQNHSPSFRWINWEMKYSPLTTILCSFHEATKILCLNIDSTLKSEELRKMHLGYQKEYCRNVCKCIYTERCTKLKRFISRKPIANFRKFV